MIICLCLVCVIHGVLCKKKEIQIALHMLVVSKLNKMLVSFNHNLPSRFLIQSVVNASGLLVLVSPT